MLAWNIAKGFAHRGGLSFADAEAVGKRMERMAEVIRAEEPDLIFLSEALLECSPCAVNQVEVLAQQCGMHAWAFGENYCFGLPFYRIVGGNAILSRLPLEGVENESLAGRQPFWVTKNNRRVLWCSTEIGGEAGLLGSIHADSFSPKNNLAQTQQILDRIGTRPAVIAGDFNANPGEPSIEALRASGRFSGSLDGPKSFPADKPVQTIDFVLAPQSWKLIENRALQSPLSDHLAIVSVFEVPAK